MLGRIRQPQNHMPEVQRGSKAAQPASAMLVGASECQRRHLDVPQLRLERA
jgi:hypothetical protein